MHKRQRLGTEEACEGRALDDQFAALLEYLNTPSFSSTIAGKVSLHLQI